VRAPSASLGHGDSDRPEEMWNYSMTNFGAQALALLDHRVEAPQRLTEEIAGFVQGCFRAKRPSGSTRRAPVATGRSAPRRG
jgi:hypothetical protein